MQICQIKEKFGGLRFYLLDDSNKVIQGMIDFAEDLSYHICEKCGSIENVTQTDGWITSLCEKCKNIK